MSDNATCLTTPDPPVAARCPTCGLPAPRLGSARLLFVLHPEPHAASKYSCPEHGLFAALDSPPGDLPSVGSESEIDQNTFILTCPHCSAPAVILQTLPVVAGTAPAFGGLQMACRTCHREWLVADSGAAAHPPRK